MTHNEIPLERFDLVHRNMDIAEFAESCCDAVDDFFIGDPLFHRVAGFLHCRACGFCNRKAGVSVGSAVELVDGKRVTVKEEFHGSMYHMAAFFSREKGRCILCPCQCPGGSFVAVEMLRVGRK